MAAGDHARPQYRELEAARLHISNDLYLRIVDVCGWPEVQQGMQQSPQLGSPYSKEIAVI